MSDEYTQQIEELKEADACGPGVERAAQYQSMSDAWKDCDRSDWMMWLVRFKFAHLDAECRQYANWCVEQIRPLIYDDALVALLDASSAGLEIDTNMREAAESVPCDNEVQEVIRAACLALCEPDGVAAASGAGSAAAAASGSPEACSTAYAVQADALRSFIPDPYETGA